MRSRIRSRPALLAIAALGLGAIPIAASFLHAQQVKCYVEVCVPTANGGESCYEKPVPCPIEQT
jgi:hypothetical protein